MALAPVGSPITLKESVVEIGGTDFRRHVSGVTFTPSASQLSWIGLSPDSAYTDTATATWTVTINYKQDWTSAAADSFSRWLYAHEGETVEMTFYPKAAAGIGFQTDVTIVPGAVGGEVNTIATASVTLGCAGKPVIVEAPEEP